MGLPKTWVETTLGEIAEWSSGGTPKKGISSYYGGDIPWIKTGDLNDGIVTEVSEYLTQEGINNSSAKIFPKDSVGIAMYGATIGKTGIFGIDAATNQACAVAKPYLGMNRFLHLYLKSQKQNFIDKGKGGAQPNISQTVIKAHKISLPPLPEQERIVAKLDVLFGQLDQMKQSLERIPQLLANFKQQVLSQAVTGKLTEAWREGKELENSFKEIKEEYNVRDFKVKLPEEWCVLSFQSTSFIKSNLVSPDDYWDYPLIAPDNIKAMTGQLINKPLVNEIKPKSPKHLFQSGAIIYSKIRPYLSKLTIVDFEGLCSADMYPIETNLNIKYLYYYMLSGLFLSYATTAGERSVLPKINQKGLNQIPVPVPSLEEQQEIVNRVESLFAKADAVEAQYQGLKAKIVSLPQAILHKAFKGELVPQLESDGDARELLSEIEKLKGEGKPKRKARTEKTL
ncbi:restriction endonuclease subunit S [Snuella lapsa]|uniref:Restriction endonuclease subunit S n=1 Tax=Snuella lapsa TaxID=870481 RepID=A0ABP6X2P7_9FLAO